MEWTTEIELGGHHSQTKFEDTPLGRRHGVRKECTQATAFTQKPYRVSIQQSAYQLTCGYRRRTWRFLLAN